MFKEINTLISNDLNNYNKRPLTKSTISYDDLQTIAAYTRLWANNETIRDRALYLAEHLDQRLYNHLECVTELPIEVTIHNDFIDILNELYAIDEALNYEEANNLGFGKEAKLFRKEWRVKLRKAHKYLDRCVRNRILGIKEHRKPRTIYISNFTGECHNGLWWTIRACITMPEMLKHGFTKVTKENK